MNETPRLVRIVPPLWFIFFLGLALVAHFFVPAARVFDFDMPYLWIAAILVFAPGVYLTQRASYFFAVHKTEILPSSPVNSALVTEGPFRFSRNPMYLGMIFMLLGIAVALGTLPVFIAALAHFFVMNGIFIPFEEQKMERQFGDQYRAYKERVRRWL